MTGAALDLNPDSNERPHIFIAITADYEIFLGKNFYNSDIVLFEPARRLAELCSRLQAPLTLFADVCSVWAHERCGATAFVQQFESQLRNCLLAGHDVQLHIHPHWEHAYLEADNWVHDDHRIHLSEFDDAASIIARGKNYLCDLLTPVAKQYDCIAYRAGGLALQPNEHATIRDLRNVGIRIDSSIAKGYTLKLDTITINYGEWPEHANWFISEETGLAPGARTGLFEVPVATFCMPLVDRYRFLVMRALKFRQRKGASLTRSQRQSKMESAKVLLSANLRYIQTNPRFLFSTDTKGFDAQMLVRGFASYVNLHQQNSTIYASMLLHPKLMFDDQFTLLEQVIVDLRRIYGPNLSFVTFPMILARVDEAGAGNGS